MLMKKEILAGRWQMDERVFVEYMRDHGIGIDIGPYPGDPDDAEITQAIEHLETLHLDFLNLQGDSWTLDLPGVLRAFPELQGEALSGTLSHPPAFLVSKVSAPVHLVGRPQAEHLDPRCFLRIDFEFTPSDVLPEWDESQRPL